MPTDWEGPASETPRFAAGDSVSYDLGLKRYFTGQVKDHFTTKHPIDRDRDVVTIVVENAVMMEQKRHFGIGPKFWEATHLQGTQHVLQRFAFPLGYAAQKYGASGPQ